MQAPRRSTRRWHGSAAHSAAIRASLSPGLGRTIPVRVSESGIGSEIAGRSVPDRQQWMWPASKAARRRRSRSHSPTGVVRPSRAGYRRSTASNFAESGSTLMLYSRRARMLLTVCGSWASASWRWSRAVSCKRRARAARCRDRPRSVGPSSPALSHSCLSAARKGQRFGNCPNDADRRGLAPGASVHSRSRAFGRGAERAIANAHERDRADVIAEFIALVV